MGDKMNFAMPFKKMRQLPIKQVAFYTSLIYLSAPINSSIGNRV